MPKTHIKERGIIFTGDNPAKILRGEKTQTRRVIDRVVRHGKISEFGVSDTPGYDWRFRCKRRLWQEYRTADLLELCPYGQVGDRLWVKETWAHCNDYDGQVLLDGRTAIYKSDGDLEPSRWRSPRFMPRWASRITLEISDVRVQRLQDIGDEDCRAEGVISNRGDGETWWEGKSQEIFAASWDAKNSRRGFPWESNQGVWAISFKEVSNA